MIDRSPRSPRSLSIALCAVLAAILVACPGDARPPPAENGGGGHYPNIPYTQLDPPSHAAYEALLERLLGGSGTTGQLSQFWTNAWSVIAPGQAYRDPASVYRYEGGPAASACGSLSTENAWYCFADNSIYFDDNLFRHFYSHLGEASPALILAHEWGHHLQSLLGLPHVSIQAELQADCFAGMFFGDLHLKEAVGYDELHAVGMLQVFVLGDRDYRASEWFQPGVHGPAGWRAKAFLDGMHVEFGYCEDYGAWTERGTEPLGSYQWLPAPGIRLERTEGDVLVAHLRDRTAYLTPRNDLGAGAAIDHIATVFGGPATRVAEAIAIDESILGGTAAVQAFEFTADGEPHHGVLFLHVATTGEAAGVSVVEAGPAPSRNPYDPSWNSILAYMFVVSDALCPPDGGNVLCLVLSSD